MRQLQGNTIRACYYLLLLLGLLLFGLLVAPVPVLTALGMRLSRGRRSVLFGYFIGLLVWVVLLLVPTVRVFVMVLLAVLGLGAWTLGLVAARGRYEWALWPGGKHRRSGDEVRVIAAGELEAADLEEDWSDVPEDDIWPNEEIGEPFDPEALQLPFEDEPGY